MPTRDDPRQSFERRAHASARALAVSTPRSNAPCAGETTPKRSSGLPYQGIANERRGQRVDKRVELGASGGGPDASRSHGAPYRIPGRRQPKRARCEFGKRAQQVGAAEHDQRAPGERRQLLKSSSLREIDDWRQRVAIARGGAGRLSATAEESQTLLQIADAVVRESRPAIRAGRRDLPWTPPRAARRKSESDSRDDGRESVNQGQECPPIHGISTSPANRCPWGRQPRVENIDSRDYPAPEVTSR